MANVFNEPYPCPSSVKQRWIISILVGLGILVFLYIFKPFGLNKVNAFFYVALSYGFIAFLVCLFCQFVFPPSFPLWFDEKNWTVGKHILFSAFIFFAVGAVNFFYSSYMGFIPFSFKGFLYFQLVTLLVGVFPVGLLILGSYAWLLRRNLQSAGIIREAIRPHRVQNHSDPLRLPSENKEDNFELSIDDLLYITSADNYVEVVYKERNEIKKRLLRNTLNAMEDFARKHPQLHRCHRAYLVNLLQVSNVVGNSQGCRLILHDTEQQIPVSRSQYKSLKEKLDNF